jgi:G:T/U-mismatch repair DNA glycosylase
MKKPMVSATETKSTKQGRASYSSTKLWAKRERKRQEAEERQEKYDSMTTLAKLKMVRSLGGSKRQLKRLEAQYQAENAAPVAAPAPAPAPAPLTEAQLAVRAKSAKKAVKKKKSE